MTALLLRAKRFVIKMLTYTVVFFSSKIAGYPLFRTAEYPAKLVSRTSFLKISRTCVMFQRVERHSDREDVKQYYAPNRKSDFITSDGTLIRLGARYANLFTPLSILFYIFYNRKTHIFHALKMFIEGALTNPDPN